LIKESSGNCYPINEIQYICHDIASIVIESLNEINCMKVSPHAVEIYEVRDPALSPAYVDIEIAQ